MQMQSPNRRRIVIVDDEIKIASLLKAILEKKFDVEICLNMRDAIACIAGRDFDIVVTDLRLPDGNGIDILKAAKEKDELIEVIIITGYASIDTATSAVNLGAASYLTKPVSLPNFVAQVDKALANRDFHCTSRQLIQRHCKDPQETRDHILNLTSIYNLSRRLTLSIDITEIMRSILEELTVKMDSCLSVIGTNLYGMAEIYAMPSGITIGIDELRSILDEHWDMAFGLLVQEEFPKGSASIVILDSAGESIPCPAMKTPIVVPMIVMGKTIGSIVVFKKNNQPYSRGEHQFMHVISSLSAPLIENGYIHLRTKNLAGTDGLTGISNHRAFQEMLSREIARCDRDKKIFCLALLDIDDFKKINDTYGHVTGDGVLKDLTARVLASIREGDIFARYGGEEFCIILPSTNLDGAVVLAERIRTTVAGLPFMLYGKEIPYTISTGLALYDSRAPFKKELLIEKADAAMYAAKRAGKNRVNTAEQVPLQ
jgi:diguanylate cyclase (GGDEF)-like protein